MNKRLPINYLKTYRRRTGVLLQDMADMIGITTGHLSKIETGQVTPSIEVILAYHLVFKIPIEDLIKNHIKQSLFELQLRSEALEERLLENRITKEIQKRLEKLRIIIDRLKGVELQYEN